MPWRQFVAAGVYWMIYAVRLRRIDWGPSIYTEFPYNWPFTTGHLQLAITASPVLEP
jgi:hypothetical protein